MTRPYGLAWLAYFLSGAGDWVSRLAIPVILYHVTGSAFYLALAYALTYLPYLLVTPVGGVVADTFDRRSLLVMCDAAAGCLVMVLAFIATAMPGTPWLLFPVLFLTCSLVAVYHPIYQSYIPTLVHPRNWDKANSYIGAADNLNDVLGPVAGGAFVGLVGAANSLWLDSASFFVSALCIYVADRSPMTCRPSRAATFVRLSLDLKEGAVYVYQDIVLRHCCILFAMTNFGLAIFSANVMYLLLGRLGLSATGAGVVLGVSGGGAIAGSLAAPFVGRYVGPGPVVVVATLLAGLGILSFDWIRDPRVVAVIWGCVLAANSIVVVTFFTLRQRIVPAELLGRAVAVSRLVSFLAIPIGSVLGGWLAARQGSLQLPILLAGLIVFASGLVGLLTPLGERAAERRCDGVKATT